jgi:F-type H+-transporting ATPase subunit epsilon
MLHFILATPSQEIYNQEVKKIILSTSTGEITVLAGHEPILSTVQSGQIVVFEKDDKKIFAAYNGVINVENIKGKTNARMLVESIDDVEKLDRDILENSIKLAKDANLRKDDNLDLEINNQLLRDLNRLKLKKRYK